MRVAHLLRKYNPLEWGGTESAVKRLFEGLKQHQIKCIAYCPEIAHRPDRDPFLESGFEVKRFKAFVPVWGISAQQKAALISVGGNLLSFHAIGALLFERNLSLIHAHTHNRLGGVALTVARLRRLPFVVTVHGGILDLPKAAHEHLIKPLKGGFEWGRLFGFALRSRRVLPEADAIITCNKTEAALLRKKFPKQRVLVQPHGVPAHEYDRDCRVAAREAFPAIVGRQLLLSVGRIDTVKNQRWLVEQAPAIFQRHPEAILVLAGACTDPAYGKSIERELERSSLGTRVLLLGGLPPGDARLIGLFQEAKVSLLPSQSEPFGLVILESWASRTPVISSRTSGAVDLIKPGETGWLFDLDTPAAFHAALDEALGNPVATKRMGEAGRALVKAEYDTEVLAGRMKALYEGLIAEGRKS
ncbi:MAG: glycosyltransferase family 1 protein [Verrucomicrobiales bacterium]|nr:glycosyltransferase family 1 protein [Verrucomicrobiales bacterium]